MASGLHAPGGRTCHHRLTPRQKMISGLTPEGFEPPAFGFGIRRAAIAPWRLLVATASPQRSERSEREKQKERLH